MDMRHRREESWSQDPRSTVHHAMVVFGISCDQKRPETISTSNSGQTQETLYITY